MKITCVTSSGKVLAENFELKGESNAVKVADLKAAYAAKNKKSTPDRQRWKYGNKVLDRDDATLWSYKIADGATLEFKDLGPQISWRLVFFLEYLGPLLIYPFFYGFGHLVYGGAPVRHTLVQDIVYMMLMFHFLKREFETLFIHRFSHGTMPLSNLFKNSGHYWLLSGVLIGWHVFQQQPKGADAPSGAIVAIALWMYSFGQMANFMTHLHLRSLRPPGSTVRKIPTGFGFGLVSCPNYFFETLVWVSILLLTQSWAVAVFTVVAVGQMYVWAVKKHKQYLKEFPKYPKERKAMFPFIA
ncbi:3-oxo-5-alpha-steroid 4-dehydrogenase-domain-containing protein [Blastocladiella britannica]|nr:3-oxo-5-alpha-steroid 4-dehydrogenase-domain-containing protein [Blastocladiella britannica]